jgi:hypothetical protein
MKTNVRRLIVAALAVAVVGPAVALAGHAPHYHDHPLLHQHKLAHMANKKAKKQCAKPHHHGQCCY